MSERCVTASHSRFLDLLNGLRRRHGVPPLRVDQELHAAAGFRAADMVERNYFAHETPGRGSASEVVDQFGYGGEATGENICWGEASAEEAFDSWFGSAPHRENMLSGRYAAIGVGGPVGSQGRQPLWGMWVTEFGSDLEREARACDGETPRADDQPRTDQRPGRTRRLPAAPPPREVRRRRASGGGSHGRDGGADRDRDRDERKRDEAARERERVRARESRRRADEGDAERRDRPTHPAGAGDAAAPDRSGGAGETGGGAPNGPIRTRNPWNGGEFGVAWADINRWDDAVRAAAAEFGVPFARIKAHIVIESQGNPRAIQKNDQNGWSFGLMQVVAVGVGWAGWGADVLRLAGASAGDAGRMMLDDPALAIRAGCHVLKTFFAGAGDWERASSTFFLGNPTWNGEDDVNGTTGQRYRDALRGLIAEVEAAAPDPDSAAAAGRDRWRPLPYPALVDLIVAKSRDGAGFDRVAARGPLTVGSCNHITEGDASIEWYRDFFAVGGERHDDALVDVVIGRDGRIGLLNDWRDPQRGGTRAGWANGDDGRLYPKEVGIAWTERFGWTVNQRLVSKEHVATPGQALTDAQMAASIALSAAVAQAARCPWDTYPLRDGVSVELRHHHFARKGCPGEPFTSVYYPILVREVRAILERHQTAGGGAAADAPPSRLAEVPLPAGVTEAGLRERFGDGFDPNGPVTLLWLREGVRTGRFPRLERFDPPGAVRRFRFADGLTIEADASGVRVVQP